MERQLVGKLSHKEWRRIAKRERRRRLRVRAATTRDLDAERLAAKLEESDDYSKWIQKQRAEEEFKKAEEAKEHELQERKWLEEEVRAQKEWRIQQERKTKARQEQLQQEARIREEFEAKQEALRLKKEEARRREEEEAKRAELVQREIDEYIDKGASTPEILRSVTNTQPGKELCPFFSKTGACRYGDTCSRNHQRLALSKVLLIPGFYSHFSLEKNSAEYDTDIGLEFDASETRQHFREFYNDVVPELESFGRIKTLKYCKNAEIHLRGNMYVEYHTEREAARALRSLKGRWYAGRQLNCEFVNLKSWRNAVCGMPKCPKGRACNFLHTLRNPRDEYDIRSPPRSRTRREASQERRFPGSSNYQEQKMGSLRSKGDQESVRGSREDSARNWRWSESPEPGPESSTRLERTDDHGRVSRSHEERRRDRRRRRESQRSSRRFSHDEESSENGTTQTPERYDDKKSRTSRKKLKKTRTHSECEGNEDTSSYRVKTKKYSKNISKTKDRENIESRRKDESGEKTRWDDRKIANVSEGNLTPRRARNRRTKSPSWSEVEASEVEASEVEASKV
ncbi:U2 small nuclear ribonucleoprotein auxiliary factor 35 kDa subunit-related protein 1 [Athalia rosae]|uniref:U2 small nuclear ribonucleoprotein auxiliary factor 35 kDa subunit-related protein 1 n=1 Tax=Athalia rosae TaxID=37344 RepID=UPI00203465A2|nr:U2 small nuclear ribonucleoprotein auxiliary factor 35 kDa subunit-related protein 1 [Athalia rosae]